jgi:hypothetical protein
MALRQPAGRIQAQGALHGLGAGSAGQHHLTNRQATSRFEEVEAVV